MRPIDADEFYKRLIEEMKNLIKSTNHESIDIEALALLAATTSILKEPTLNVAPIVYGKWLHMKDGNANCSVCGRHVIGVYDDDSADRYCRHCGAKMDLEELS